MRTMTCEEFLADCAGTVDTVGEDGEGVVVTRPGHESVVIVPLAEYASLKETVHLLRSPGNARRLFASINRLENDGDAARDADGRRPAAG
ncbi:type II toxin-antitoxin system Phd/YefM family antitoxin [Streptomyces cyaneofuscatus]|uniref:type II toxin-antitoxin system Phd/YefM family antitoxin n=1 Tax=Streptomyces cyaneofuscatus TaxID=66883 RepID=UPI003447CDAB